MTRTNWLRLAGAALLVLTVAVGVAVWPAAPAQGAAGETYHIDADHALDSADAKQAFEGSGVARANVSSPALSITVATEASACGVESSLFSDTRNDYLCLDYREDVSATIRLWIPKHYWHPYVRQTKQPLTDGPTATFGTADARNYTSVRVRFDGRSTAVYPIPRDVSVTYNLLARADARTQNWLGVELWSTGTTWQYVNQSAFRDGESATVSIKAAPSKTILQYDATPASDPTWLTVPSDRGDSAPVYRMQREGVDNTIYVVAETADPPTVRYRAQGGTLGQIDAALDEIMSIPDKIDTAIDDLLSGIDVPWGDS